MVKLHTGGGKTLVAPLMAQSVMNEIGEPVLYLAPTNQLVGQVLAKGHEYGISALPYTKGQSLPGEFYDGKSVLVGAYEMLFNGRSKYGVRGSGQSAVKVGAIILDDAHVALSSVREAFTLTIRRRTTARFIPISPAASASRFARSDAAVRTPTSRRARITASSRCRVGLASEARRGAGLPVPAG